MPQQKLSWTVGSNFLLFIASIAVACLLAEGLLRLTVANGFVLFPRFHVAAQYGDYTLRRTKPGIAFTHTSVDGQWHYTINAQGFRDDHDYTYAKPPGVRRILVLGDSHTLGYEAHASAIYSKVLERRLTALGHKVEVLNTGVSGFSTAEQLAFLEQEGFRYSPDVVVLGFFRNDFEDNIKADLFRLDQGRLVEVKKTYAPGVHVLEAINRIPGTPWLSQWSYLYSVGLNAAWNAGKRGLLNKARANLATEYAISTQELNRPMEELELALVRRMHSATKAHGVSLVIADIPVRDGQGGFLPSVPENMVATFRGDSEAFAGSQDYLARYAGQTEFHVPHGNWHINEFTHLILGLDLADRINGLLQSTPAAAAPHQSPFL